MATNNPQPLAKVIRIEAVPQYGSTEELLHIHCDNGRVYTRRVDRRTLINQQNTSILETQPI